jgi:hypothetical protein
MERKNGKEEWKGRIERRAEKKRRKQVIEEFLQSKNRQE